MAAGEEIYDSAARAAGEIPKARFLTLQGHRHLLTPDEVEQVPSAVQELFRDASR